VSGSRTSHFLDIVVGVRGLIEQAFKLLILLRDFVKKPISPVLLHTESYLLPQIAEASTASDALPQGDELSITGGALKGQYMRNACYKAIWWVVRTISSRLNLLDLSFTSFSRSFKIAASVSVKAS
jgi:hypothetical protein